MTKQTITLPDSDWKFVEEQASKGGYSSPSDYLRLLIREDQKRQDIERLEALLLEGMNSGNPIIVDDAYWERFEARLKERHGQGKAEEGL